MSLPALQDWDATRNALHQAAQVVGAVRKSRINALPNYAHLGLFVTKSGLSTGALTEEDHLLLDMQQQAVIYTCPAGSIHVVPIRDHTQVSLTDAVLQAMTDAGHPASIDRSKLTGTDLLSIRPDAASQYGNALYSLYSSLARVRGRLMGSMSPLIVWPHGFDLSFLWFKRGFEERTDPHLNFGFSPGSTGLPRPYVYAYAYPLPATFFDIGLPEGARFNIDPWKGIVIDYDWLTGLDDHEHVLEDMLYPIYATLASQME
ncbi:MAG: hypothetical protein J0L63_15570 [Anaerolineae bacterium]|nr:hypothetical protein [Anaerolineae bacterium]